ncbi:phosphoglycerate mutase-like protein [Stereum hirsutum FP-91666 SS1]|uniref:phosphoglycerate mutase-like protein n=1 Tax=Stereum hirsutum (strain FP-91666) TaxID=721885 RepID=UPI00044493DC|nr:phosphoglycerate mutase-like protein [Stereum hirsutum FP-91666 SS1]EIM84911.1 phosphoglycerate mutase-like protein [Stereum hirsutum FP-91666 SS1]
MKSVNSSEAQETASPWKYVTVSLVRHAQCESNVNPNSKPDDADPDPLTSEGQSQATALGNSYAHTRIDVLLSSTYERAVSTALEISKSNDNDVPITKEPNLIERKLGTSIPRLMSKGLFKTAIAERDGNLYDGSVNREHRPQGGGESLSDVERRSENVLAILLKYAVALDKVPSVVEGNDPVRRYEASTGDDDTGGLQEVPEGIKHVVLVSHNAYMGEFYEMLLSWGKDDHEQTAVHYGNTQWVTDDEETEVQFWDLKPPPS